MARTNEYRVHLLGGDALTIHSTADTASKVLDGIRGGTRAVFTTENGDTAIVSSCVTAVTAK